MSKELIKAVPHLDGVLYVDEHCEIKVGNMMYDSKTHEVSRLNRGEMPYLWEYQIIAKSNLNIEGVPYAVIDESKERGIKINGVGATPIGYEVAESFTDNDKQYIKLKPVY